MVRSLAIPTLLFGTLGLTEIFDNLAKVLFRDLLLKQSKKRGFHRHLAFRRKPEPILFKEEEHGGNCRTFIAVDEGVIRGDSSTENARDSRNTQIGFVLQEMDRRGERGLEQPFVTQVRAPAVYNLRRNTHGIPMEAQDDLQIGEIH